jgi:hypothetical protein
MYRKLLYHFHPNLLYPTRYKRNLLMNTCLACVLWWKKSKHFNSQGKLKLKHRYHNFVIDLNKAGQVWSQLYIHKVCDRNKAGQVWSQLYIHKVCDLHNKSHINPWSGTSKGLSNVFNWKICMKYCTNKRVKNSMLAPFIKISYGLL